TRESGQPFPKLFMHAEVLLKPSQGIKSWIPRRLLYQKAPNLFYPLSWRVRFFRPARRNLRSAQQKVAESRRAELLYVLSTMVVAP
ncbi:MAG: hypothetical protein M1376_18600, partial [Planctomycetes bacterium]|nr:hypothetical protein [Planctomycetota bacterium]